VVTQMTPQKAENLFARVGNMDPSKSSLDRLPKALGERWESAAPKTSRNTHLYRLYKNGRPTRERATTPWVHSESLFTGEDPDTRLLYGAAPQ
jgi:hypothetical protein